MILLYHKIAPFTPTCWWVSADTFNRQMAALSAYDVVYLSEYDPNNPRHAVITFDGVYENIFQFALPILHKWNYPFELFVTGNYIGLDNSFDTPEPLARFCTVEQLEIMHNYGARVQWHTASHQHLETLSNAEILREICVPTELRNRFLPPHFDWFAYPHGAHSDAVVKIVREQFKGACSCIAGNNEDRYQFNRVIVDEKTLLDKSRVTVIVANYNYGVFLPEAIDSVLKQTIAPDEIILIDDCSTDGSQDVVRRYENVAHVVLNETNLGIVDNFNKAVSLATGDYIAFLGADNRMRSDYIERCKTALDQNPEAAVAYTDMTIFGARASQLAKSVGATPIGESVSERWPIYLWQFPEPTQEVLSNMKTKNFIHGSSMYRRTAFDQAGGFRRSNTPEDHNLFLRMLNIGWKPFHVREALIEYRQHSLAQANTVLGLQMKLNQLKEKHDETKSELDAKISNFEKTCASLQSQLDSVYTSKSWRITRPLRFAFRCLKNLKYKTLVLLRSIYKPIDGR